MKLLWQKSLTVVSFVGNKTYFICLSYIRSAGMRPILGVSKKYKYNGGEKNLTTYMII